MPNQLKLVLKSAVNVFMLAFAIALVLSMLAFVYLIAKAGWTGALAYAMSDVKEWLIALILMPTVCTGADLLGSAIDGIWRLRK